MDMRPKSPQAPSVEELLLQLERRDPAEGYAALLELERLSALSDRLCPHLARFGTLCQSRRSFVRVRGFRLLCAQARWAEESALEAELLPALSILQDSRPTVVRQALAALQTVVRHRPSLRGPVLQAAAQIDCLGYRDTVQGLLQKDIQALAAAAEAPPAAPPAGAGGRERP